MFLSSVVILIDFTPTDFLPSQQKIRNAIDLLEEHDYVIRNPDIRTNYKFEGEDKKPLIDNQIVDVLLPFLERHTNPSIKIEWNRVLGIGHAKVNIPVGQFKLVAYHPIFVVYQPGPESGDVTLQAYPIGTLDETKGVLTDYRFSKLSLFALILLCVGFFIQLIQPFLEDKGRVETGNNEKENTGQEDKSLSLSSIESEQTAERGPGSVGAAPDC